MTYCLAARPDAGLVFCSDSRTNAGVDHVSTYSKMYRFGIDGERQFVILTAGNLATTQGVIQQVKRDMDERAERSLRTLPSLIAAADYLGELSLAQQSKHGSNAAAGGFGANFIIGGQVHGGKPEIHLVYPEGNHITSSKDTPYLQIGESKYGKPILDRILARDTSLETAALCTLVSMDSTMRSNLTVGPPIEVLIYQRDSFVLKDYHRFEDGSEYLRELNKAWDEQVKLAFHRLPPLAWAFSWDRPRDAQSEVS
ncbi:MAG: peptidase [Gammaproteobacteria bacterium]|nr:peptidase [Gammaproteobacteria bacterium]